MSEASSCFWKCITFNHHAKLSLTLLEIYISNISKAICNKSHYCIHTSRVSIWLLSHVSVNNGAPCVYITFVWPIHTDIKCWCETINWRLRKLRLWDVTLEVVSFEYLVSEVIFCKYCPVGVRVCAWFNWHTFSIQIPKLPRY